MSIKINCDRTKRGLPSLAEEGDSNNLYSTATIIANHKGGTKKAIYIPKVLNTFSKKHAHFVVKPNDVKIELKKSKGSISVRIFRIKQFLKLNSVIEMELIESYDKETLSLCKHSIFKAAIDAGITKLNEFYHNKPAYYWVENKKESH